MPYRRISQAGLQDLPSFFTAAQIHVEEGFGGEASVEEVNVLRSDLR
jgi:hypothetical protein